MYNRTHLIDPASINTTIVDNVTAWYETCPDGTVHRFVEIYYIMLLTNPHLAEMEQSTTGQSAELKVTMQFSHMLLIQPSMSIGIQPITQNTMMLSQMGALPVCYIFFNK